jgi:hypothetical protein
VQVMAKGLPSRERAQFGQQSELMRVFSKRTQLFRKVLYIYITPRDRWESMTDSSLCITEILGSGLSPPTK